MRGRRLLASILVVALGGVSLGVATAWYSDSATIEYQISAASDFGDEDEEKVWVCKLVGSPSNAKVKEGKNPIHVSVNSADADEGFADAHPSYVVDNGDVECLAPSDDTAHVTEDNERVEASETDTTSTSTTGSTTSTSTSTTTSSTSTTTSTSSTTTSTSTSTSSTTTSTSSTTTTTTLPSDG